MGGTRRGALLFRSMDRLAEHLVARLGLLGRLLHSTTRAEADCGYHVPARAARVLTSGRQKRDKGLASIPVNRWLLDLSRSCKALSRRESSAQADHSSCVPRARC